MEINPTTIQQLLDKASVLYNRTEIQHGVNFKIIDSNGKLPKDVYTVTVYNSGTVSIFVPTFTLRQLIDSLR